jgi:hypothetical protein
MSVHHPIAAVRADIADRRLGPQATNRRHSDLRGTSEFVGWIIAPRERPERPRQMSHDQPIYL